ncbi:MAG: superoxide dismutase [Pedosphaera sp.]|nr:superoxide dismutase [Pedosphaera sp.]MSU42687.1 superoxide dismutase [Pedosphaera sp.]
MSHTLPELPYPKNALEPHIDTKTMEIHHGKHHNAYVTNLNKALEGKPELAAKSIEALIGDLNAVPAEVRGAVRNNGGGHANHSFFWKLMGANCGGAPTGELAAAITTTFGSVEAFKEKFEAAGIGRFGSGWVWLCVKADKSLCICSTPNQDSPLMNGVAECTGTPVLACDVWEHAYYLNYQNRRADYLKAFWNVLSWQQAEANYQAAKA